MKTFKETLLYSLSKSIHFLLQISKFFWMPENRNKIFDVYSLLLRITVIIFWIFPLKSSFTCLYFLILKSLSSRQSSKLVGRWFWWPRSYIPWKMFFIYGRKLFVFCICFVIITYYYKFLNLWNIIFTVFLLKATLPHKTFSLFFYYLIF